MNDWGNHLFGRSLLVDQHLDALTAVHAHGIVHRDVKPSRLLPGPTGQARSVPRLADVGIAAVVGETGALTDD
jgi:eukaryotic-like serine/threonine-protein kinase